MTVDSAGSPSLLRRMTVALLEAGCRAMWGFAPRMIPPIVAELGAGGSLRWFAANMPRYLISTQVLGARKVHLAGMVVSLHNGCLYCAHGHGYALELLHLRDRDRLFPLDSRALGPWLELPPRELGARVQEVLRGAGMQAEAVWVDITLGLVTGEQVPVDADEGRLAHLVRMFGTMNRIAVAAGCLPDEAQDPVNKDAAVKRRNTALRAAAG